MINGMYRVIDLLERALRLHECVVLPGIGGFVREFVFSRYDQYTRVLHPASERIHFNAYLLARDGILDEQYVHLFSLSTRRARLMLDEDIALLRRDLFKHGYVTIGNLGSLSVTDNGQILFTPDNQKGERLAPCSYGLYPRASIVPSNPIFSILPTALPSSSSQEAPSVDTRFLYFRVRKSFLGWGAAFIALAICLLPVTSSTSIGRYSAGFIPSATVESLIESNLGEEEIKNILPENTSDSQSLSLESETQENENSSKLDTQVIFRENLIPGMYVVVGAFKTESKALEYCAYLASKDRRLSSQLFIASNGSNRLVLLSRFDSQAKAHSFISDSLLCHEISELRSAWVWVLK